MKIKVLNYNIHKGFNWGNRKLVLNDIRQVIRESEADLVFLQEVVGENILHAKNHENWPTQSQFEFLADEVWQHYSYAKNAVYSHRHHGNVLLSKFPIEDWHQEDISTNRFEQRGILASTIKIPAHYDQNNSDIYLHTYCLHLDLLHTGRKKQYQSLYQKITSELDAREPIIIAGDFNDWNKKSKTTFEDKLHMFEVYHKVHGKYARTYPAQLPLLSLDRIYIKNLDVVTAKVYNNPMTRKLSDHLPMLAELEIYVAN